MGSTSDVTVATILRRIVDAYADVIAPMAKETIGEAADLLDAMHGQTILLQAAADGAGSMMLSVQQDCIAERQARLAAEAERDSHLEELGRVIMACPPGYRAGPKASDGVKKMRADMEARRVVVKDLEWGEVRYVPDAAWSKTMLRQHIGHHNLGPFAGSYAIQEMEPGGAWGWWNTWTADIHYPDGVEPTDVTAKAAAQADFATRIRTVVAPVDHGTTPESNAGTVCEHGIRWPWACHQCDEIALRDRASAKILVDAIQTQLINIGVGGCTCDVKSPDIQYHAENCTYRRAEECGANVEALAIIIGARP